MKDFTKKVSEIQAMLKAPKSQYNAFGKYSYRNCEDILEAVKPLLKNAGLVLTINDEVVEVGSRIYIKSTSMITDGENKLTNSAMAREPEEQKGMNASQVSGACSSYARKYSLNGLFLIDDTRDADATNTHGKDAAKEQVMPEAPTTAQPEKLATSNKPAPSFKRPSKTLTVVPSSGDDL